MPICGSTQRRLSFDGAGRDHPDWVGRKQSNRWSRARRRLRHTVFRPLLARTPATNVPFPSLP